MPLINPFNPARNANQVVTTGAASASVTIPSVNKSVRLSNAGTTNPCHVVIGTSPQTATTADLVVLAGQSVVVTKGEEEDTVAYIQSGGATTLHIHPGEGGV